MRLRILVGTIVLVIALGCYGLAVMGIAVRLLPDQVLIQTIFYALAGVAWVPPAARLTRWMQASAPFRPPPADQR